MRAFLMLNASAVIRPRGCSIAVGGDMTLVVIVRVPSGRSRGSLVLGKGSFTVAVCMGGLRCCLLQERVPVACLLWGRAGSRLMAGSKLHSGKNASSRTGESGEYGGYTVREEEEDSEVHQRGFHEGKLSGFCFGSSHATTREYSSAIVATPRNLRSLQHQAVCRG
jgi:hypothetical protein